MLPYFTTSGHNLYAKSAWIYLNQMECLKEQNAEVAALFEGGYHVIRQTYQYWAGISSDLAIEQALMRSIKTTGGLTRERGMSESQTALWILSLPDCAEISMRKIAYVVKKRDTKDTMIFASFLEESNPFVEEEGMRNIETGVSATADVNADRAKDIGLSILKSMEVFDRKVTGPDMKDTMHLKRTKGIFGTKVSFTKTTPFRSKKELVFANNENKQNFIEMLSKNMHSNSIETKHASADADLLITKTAEESSISHLTILQGGDTDLLVLLLYYYNFRSMNLIFKPNHVKTTKSNIWT
ncbi:unnamed protein product [Mytilus coruscus]|uniref:Uncharacterized protein n=1 Tax=Mytilus coruscus TaxID=42192 RepID=A0A6J8CI30_MYTCO|nr:unnamed protein product [Mytilus coruscus]